MRRSQTNALLGKSIQGQSVLVQSIAQQASLLVELTRQFAELVAMISLDEKVDPSATKEMRERLQSIADRLKEISQMQINPN